MDLFNFLWTNFQGLQNILNSYLPLLHFQQVHHWILSEITLNHQIINSLSNKKLLRLSCNRTQATQIRTLMIRRYITILFIHRTLNRLKAFTLLFIHSFYRHKVSIFKPNGLLFNLFVAMKLWFFMTFTSWLLDRLQVILAHLLGSSNVRPIYGKLKVLVSQRGPF
jgi:hypothetical protein